MGVPWFLTKVSIIHSYFQETSEETPLIFQVSDILNLLQGKINKMLQTLFKFNNITLVGLFLFIFMITTTRIRKSLAKK